MTKNQACKLLAECFRALNKRQKSNLLWHVEHGSTFLCGKHADEYVLPGKGG